MSLLLALSFAARAEPPASDPPEAVEPTRDRRSRRRRRRTERAVEEPEASPDPARQEAIELARRLADLAENPDRLSRTALCRELVPMAEGVEAETLASLKVACPSWFPVPAPPTFCRIDPCVTDVPFDEGSDRTAAAPE
ncbi:MAG: hypothetical protein AAF602_11505 [Myxococcota bacterium]